MRKHRGGRRRCLIITALCFVAYYGLTIVLFLLNENSAQVPETIKTTATIFIRSNYTTVHISPNNVSEDSKYVEVVESYQLDTQDIFDVPKFKVLAEFKSPCFYEQRSGLVARKDSVERALTFPGGKYLRCVPYFMLAGKKAFFLRNRYYFLLNQISYFKAFQNVERQIFIRGYWNTSSWLLQIARSRYGGASGATKVHQNLSQNISTILFLPCTKHSCEKLIATSHILSYVIRL